MVVLLVMVGVVLVVVVLVGMVAVVVALVLVRVSEIRLKKDFENSQIKKKEKKTSDARTFCMVQLDP